MGSPSSPGLSRPPRSQLHRQPLLLGFPPFNGPGLAGRRPGPIVHPWRLGISRSRARPTNTSVVAATTFQPKIRPVNGRVPAATPGTGFPYMCTSLLGFKPPLRRSSPNLPQRSTDHGLLERVVGGFQDQRRGRGHPAPAAAAHRPDVLDDEPAGQP